MAEQGLESRFLKEMDLYVMSQEVKRIKKKKKEEDLWCYQTLGFTNSIVG